MEKALAEVAEGFTDEQKKVVERMSKAQMQGAREAADMIFE